MTLAQTIGIDMPHDFPTSAYNAVNVKLGPERPRDPDVWGEYGAGWNAVASRFKMVADADDRFTRLIRQNPSHNDIQAQQEALFTFFVGGYAVIESYAYATYAIGALIRPTDFPMLTDNDLRSISPISTQRKYAAHFVGTSIDLELTSFIEPNVDPAFQEWGLIRNVLAHRIAPSRRIHVSIHEGPRPDTTPVRPTEWKIMGGLVLNERTTSDRRAWLAKTLVRLVNAADAFAQTHFS
jgi:hypothetical protein